MNDICILNYTAQSVPLGTPRESLQPKLQSFTRSSPELTKLTIFNAELLARRTIDECLCESFDRPTRDCKMHSSCETRTFSARWVKGTSRFCHLIQITSITNCFVEPFNSSSIFGFKPQWLLVVRRIIRFKALQSASRIRCQRQPSGATCISPTYFSKQSLGIGFRAPSSS